MQRAVTTVLLPIRYTFRPGSMIHLHHLMLLTKFAIDYAIVTCKLRFAAGRPGSVTDKTESEAITSLTSLARFDLVASKIAGGSCQNNGPLSVDMDGLDSLLLSAEPARHRPTIDPP